MHPNIHHKHMRAHTLYKLTDQLFSFADEATPLHGETGPNSTSILESSSFSTDDLPRMLKSKKVTVLSRCLARTPLLHKLDKEEALRSALFGQFTEHLRLAATKLLI